MQPKDLLILAGTFLIQMASVHAFRRAAWRDRSYAISAIWSGIAAAVSWCILWLLGVPPSIFLICAAQLVLTLGMVIGFLRVQWLRRVAMTRRSVQKDI